MTFDEWFVKYPLPAEIDTMDDTDREQWTWALRSAYKTGAASTREWVGLTEEEVKALVSWWPSYDQMPALMVLVKDIQNSIKEKNT